MNQEKKTECCGAELEYKGSLSVVGAGGFYCKKCGELSTPSIEKEEEKQCTCIEHNNGGEMVIIVNDCPIHDKIFGSSAVITPSPDLVDKEVQQKQNET